MKGFRLLRGILALLALVTLASCAKSEFGVTDNSEKHMTLTAKNAAKDSEIMIGSLEVNEGEQIVITSGLEKGSVRVEIIAAPQEQSKDEVPAFDGDPVITANLKAGDRIAGNVSAGSYMMKATCLEKATGTVEIDVASAE